MSKTPRIIQQPDKYSLANPTTTSVRLQSGSYVTIGGIQYAITSNLDASLPSNVTANTLYFMYVVLSSGSPALVISTNVNSVGPSGFTAWKLVGAFYSNGFSTVTFGSFVNIYGVPVSQSIQQAPLVITGSVSNPTKNTGAVSVDYADFVREGQNMVYTYGFNMASGGSNGAGSYKWPLPTNLSFDSSKMAFSTLVGDIGGGRIGNATIAFVLRMNPSSTTTIGAQVWQGGTAAALSFDGAQTVNGGGINFSNGNIYCGWQVIAPISGWTNTPLVDL